jgi:hypothetical protein
MRKNFSILISLLILTFLLGGALSPRVLASDSPREEEAFPAAIEPGNFTLKESLNKISWTNILGTLSVGYSMVLDPINTYEYITVASLTASPALTTGLHPIYFDTFRVEESFWVYWNDEGVNANASGDAAIMWDILNGDLPMFYIKYDGSYSLVDGYIYETSGQTQEEPWRVNGDLPLDTYHFGGWVTYDGGGSEYLNIQMTFTKVATVSLIQEASSCGYVDVLIHLANVHDLYALDLILSFDETALEVVDLLLDDPGTTDVVENPGVNIEPISDWFNAGYPVINDADNDFGVIQYTATQLNTAAPAEGEGDVARIRFKALTGDSSTVSVASAELSDRDGFLVGSPVSLQSVTVSPTMAPANVDLDIIRLNPSTVQLSWPKEMLDAGVEYNLHRSTLPYFDITDPLAVFDTTNTGFGESGGMVTYDDPVLGDVTNNYFYALQTVCSNDLAASPVSDQVGKFEFELFETNKTDYSWIGLVLENSAISTDKTLGDHIEENIFAGEVVVKTINRWNPVGQSFTTYIHGDGSTSVYDVYVKQAYQIEVDITGTTYGSVIWAQVGKLPAITKNTYTLHDTNKTDYSWILQPLDFVSIFDSTALAANIELNASDLVVVDSISRWNGTGQSFTVDQGSNAFTTRFGYPYMIELHVINESPVTWP